MSDNNTSERKPLILIAEDVESNYKLLEIIRDTCKLPWHNVT